MSQFAQRNKENGTEMRENMNNGAEMIEMEWKCGRRCGSD